jgi:hypothetical protein
MLTAVIDSELLALAGRFLTAAARWPCLMTSMQARLENQRAHLAVEGLIAHIPRVEHRLLLMLWHLADRWGRVTPEGTAIPLALSHDLLSQLAAARRSTTTIALSALERDGRIARLDDGSWLLTTAAERMVQAIAKTMRPPAARPNARPSPAHT